MAKKLAEVFGIPEKPISGSGAVQIVEDVFSGESTLERAESGTIEVSIDIKKAEKLNKFVQTELASVYALASDAASEMVAAIKCGDVDARSVEGTAKLLEAATKALTEMNNYNMFVQKHLVERGLRAEMEKLQQQISDNRNRISREKLLEIAATNKEDTENETN